ncbi:hypothetical protein IL306_011485 [Fusarium sp. DS 682]|nr:hypothetical protein IL306_011485 [Fusarium sp. DS 682]
MRRKCRKRQLRDPQRKSIYEGQVTRARTASFHMYRSEEALDCPTYTSSGNKATQYEESLVKDEATDLRLERNTYVQEAVNGKTGTSLVEDLEEKIRCLTITFEDLPIRTVSPGIEEAYMQGEALTPPEIKFSEDGDMEDNYWTWDQDTQRFRHWDAELGEWVCFPERFD